MHPAAPLADLDPEQAAAVTTPSTLVAVIAAAGSGKTRVLTRRIAHRVASGSADSRHVLALTFTREAAGELRRRLRRAGLREPVEAGTFHAVARNLLTQRWRDLDAHAPTIVGDRERLLAGLASGIPLATLATEADWVAARGIAPGEYVAAARAAGRRVAAPADRVATALDAYETLKRRRGVVDLDDLLTIAVRELTADAAWADAVRYRYRHVLVDEAQDLNPVQYRLLELLVGGRDDLYLVGDPAQAIYGFNGSDPALLGEIGSRLPGIEIIRLPTNHRCTPQIVAAGLHVLRRGGQDAEAVSGRGDGPAVAVVAAADEDDEAARVATALRRMDPDLVRNGHAAVLARTNAQLGRLTAALHAAGVPVRERHLTPGSPLAMVVRAATALPSASRLRAWAHDVLDSAPTSTGPGPEEEAERRVAAAVLEFLREQPFGDGATLRTWLAATNPLNRGPEADGVDVLTFHGAKGREWHTVVVTGVETGLVPHRSAGTLATKAEEARLLHVALTRATDQLVLSWAARRGGYSRRPSPFIADLPTGAAVAVPAPPELRARRRPPDGRRERLLAWRADAARAASVLPSELCTDADVEAVLAAAPTSPAELAAATSFGPLTATRLFPAVRAALDEDATPTSPDRAHRTTP